MNLLRSDLFWAILYGPLINGLDLNPGRSKWHNKVDAKSAQNLGGLPWLAAASTPSHVKHLLCLYISRVKTRHFHVRLELFVLPRKSTKGPHFYIIREVDSEPHAVYRSKVKKTCTGTDSRDQQRCCHNLRNTVWHTNMSWYVLICLVWSDQCDQHKIALKSVQGVFMVCAECRNSPKFRRHADDSGSASHIISPASKV